MEDNLMTKNDKNLTDEVLSNVSGGELKEDDVSFYLDHLMVLSKMRGNSKEFFIQFIEDCWNDNKMEFSTTGSQEDHDALIKRINDEYDTCDLKYHK